MVLQLLAKLLFIMNDSPLLARAYLIPTSLGSSDLVTLSLMGVGLFNYVKR